MAAVAEQTRFSFPIMKWDTTDDGDLIVYGKCTDDTIDADQQTVDSKWSGKALDEWFAKAANVRVQHSPFLYPAGKGLALDLDRDGDGAHWLRARVVEDTAKKLVKAGVLQDFSIGILNPRVVNHHRAIGGKICGGEIGEVSLCDRGSNKNSRFTIAKSAPGGEIELIAKFTGVSPLAMPHRVINKGGRTRIVDSGGRDRSHVPASDFAGPDHTYPVEDQADVTHGASLAHHADDPAQVRTRIRAIANRKWPGMTMPPTLADKADDDTSDDKTCIKCKAKNAASAAKCASCGAKLGMVIKGDAAQDGVNVEDDDSDDEQAAAASADGKEPKPDDDDKSDKALFTKKPGKRKPKKPNPFAPGGPLADKSEDDPSSVAGGAKGKESKPAPGPDDPDSQIDDVPGSDFGNKDVPVSMRKLHDATCPAMRWKTVRKGYGLQSVADAMPVRELQSYVVAAISKGATTAASEFLNLVSAAETIQRISPDELAEARKAFPELFPTAHPTVRTSVSPGDFQRSYLGAGRPTLSAQAAGAAHPNAPVHNVSAADFSRGYLPDGRAAAPAPAGRQATSSTAVLGQAMTSMAVLHDHVKLAYPDLCQANVTLRDYTQGDGHTGMSAATLPSVPAAPGENGNTGPMTKMQKKIEKQRREIDRLGAQPDPRKSPYRGVPVLGGPVDRTSQIDKALQPQAGGQSAEYVEFIQQYLRSGDPRVRANAEQVLKTIGASTILPEEDD